MGVFHFSRPAIQLAAVLAQMEKDYYDGRARAIQALWRGFYCRKHVHNYFARKAYLKGVEEKNAVVRCVCICCECVGAVG